MRSHVFLYDPLCELPQEMHTAYLNNATHTPTLKYETLLKVLWNQQDLVWENFNEGV